MTEDELNVFSKIRWLNKIELGMLLQHLEDKFKTANTDEVHRYIPAIWLVERRLKELTGDESTIDKSNP